MVFVRDDQIQIDRVDRGDVGAEPLSPTSQDGGGIVVDPTTANLPDFDPARLRTWKESLRNPKIKAQLIRLLSKTLVFAQASEQFRSAIADAVMPLELAPGQVVFRHGHQGTWLGILLSGRLDRLLERQHREIHTGDVGPGGLIGDLGLFGVSVTRTYTVTALTPSVILVLSHEKFADAIAAHGMPASLAFFRDGIKVQNLMADTESFLNLRCFQRLDRDFVLALREHSEPRLCYPNQTLMREGHFGDEMYILRAGSVKIEKNGKFVVELPAGVVLGELAVLGSDKRRTATVVCSSLCLIRALHADVFHEILDKFPAAKRVFDHAYIARLVSLEVSNAKEEMQQLARFHCSPSPKHSEEMQKLIGVTLKKADDKRRNADNSKLLMLPPLTMLRPPATAPAAMQR